MNDFRVLARPRTPLRAVALAVTLATMSAQAFALGLGSPDVLSYLGQPLQLRIPVVLDDPADGSQCPRIVPIPGPDVPTLAMGRIDVERGVTQSFLRISTALPIDEPVLRVVVEIGCQRRVQREFTLLLDPPIAVAQRDAPALPSAPRLEFGRPEVLGVRGQPLLMTVPFSGQMAPLLSDACVRAVRGETSELPRVLSDARVSVIEQGGGRALRIHTPDPVNDARVRVLVELGCDQPVRQEFVVQIDAPRLAATPADAADVAREPVAVPAPAVKRSAPPQRPPAPPKPALPAAVAPPPAASLEPPATTAPAAPTAEPSRVAPPVPATRDRLVLSAPEDTVPAQTPRSDDTKAAPPPAVSEEREQVLKRLEQLTAEVKTLRAELDAAAQRNRELSERAQSASYAWAFAVGAALLVGVGLLVGRRRVTQEQPAVDADKAGPMTRILGKHADTQGVPPRAATPMVGFPAGLPPSSTTEGAGGDTVAAIIAAHRAAQGHEDTGASTNIVVTEFGDTSQAIKELYSPYVIRSGRTVPGVPTRPAPAGEPADERTTMLAPPTKTELAVDIDLGSNTEIGRDLKREYERLDVRLAGKEGDAAKNGKKGAPEAELPTRLSADTDATMPATPSKLSLDLDLDLPTVAAPKKDA